MAKINNDRNLEFSVFATPVFKKQFDRLCKKYPSLPEDVNALTERLLLMPVQGDSMGHGLYKVRMAIASKGQGKSGGARVITCIKLVENKIVFVTMYDKSERETMTIKELLKLLTS